jgi:hypothetical protein
MVLWQMMMATKTGSEAQARPVILTNAILVANTYYGQNLDRRY